MARQSKAEIQAYQKAYREAHREKQREYNRAYYARNAFKLKAASSAKRAQPKTEEQLAKIRADAARHSSEYRARHPERVNKWARENKSRVLELQRDWRKAHPEHDVAKSAVRRAREKGNGGSLTRKDVASVKEMADGICAYCLQKSDQMQLEHCIPLSRGGAHDWTNVVMACTPCNRAKGDQTPLEFLLGWPRVTERY